MVVIPVSLLVGKQARKDQETRYRERLCTRAMRTINTRFTVGRHSLLPSPVSREKYNTRVYLRVRKRGITPGYTSHVRKESYNTRVCLPVCVKRGITPGYASLCKRRYNTPGMPPCVYKVYNPGYASLCVLKGV